MCSRARDREVEESGSDVEGVWKARGVLATSARRWEELFRSIFSLPRSSRRARTMDWISS